jgi:hypothetical protein
MYDRSQDRPVGHPQNYSANPRHPFNQIVAGLVALAPTSSSRLAIAATPHRGRRSRAARIEPGIALRQE